MDRFTVNMSRRNENSMISPTSCNRYDWMGASILGKDAGNLAERLRIAQFQKSRFDGSRETLTAAYDPWKAGNGLKEPPRFMRVSKSWAQQPDRLADRAGKWTPQPGKPQSIA